jgi:protein SCO1/2
MEMNNTVNQGQGPKDSRKKKIFKIVVLVSLLILPTVLFYVFIYTGVHKVSRLPFYGPVKMTEAKVKGKTITDTVYFEIPSVNLTKTDSSFFNPLQLERRIYIAQFLDFAKMDSIPNQVIFCASEILKKKTDIYFITYLEHYNNQPLPKPSTFTKSLEGKDTSWLYIVVPDNKLDSVKTGGYFIKDPDMKDAVDPYSMVLVDKERRIRGYYNPTLASDIKRAQGEIEYLKKEYFLNYRTHKYYEYEDNQIKQKDLKNKKR